MIKSYKRLVILWGLLAFPFFLLTGCLKEGTDTIVLPYPYGKIPYDVIPQHIQDSLIDRGFVINEGVNPPTVKGKFLLSPMMWKYASDGYYNPNFRKLYVGFSGQMPRGKVNYIQGQSDSIFLEGYQINEVVGIAERARIIGEDSSFTLYCIQTIQVDKASWSKTASVVSGTLTKNGIRDCQYAEYIIEKNDEYERISEPGTFCYWNDGDGLAEKYVKSSEK